MPVLLLFFDCALFHLSPIVLVCCIAHGLWSPEPFKVSVCSLQSQSQCLCCPSMMDDGVYCSPIPLALFRLIGLKRFHLDLTSMVTGPVYV